MTAWHVLKTPEGEFAARTWRVENAAMRRPRLDLAADLNQNEITRVVCLYTSYDDAVAACLQYHDTLGIMVFPVPVEFHGQGPKAIMLEKTS